MKAALATPLALIPQGFLAHQDCRAAPWGQSASAAQVNIATSGSDRLTVASNGNVGIGTGPTGPTAKLDVGGDINFTGSFRYNGTPLITFSGGALALGRGAMPNNAD